MHNIFHGIIAATLAGLTFLAATTFAAEVESFQIRNQKFGQLLRPEDARSADGTSLVLFPAQPWKCMTWKLHPAGKDVFQLQNHLTSKTFAPKGDETAAPVLQVPFGPEGSSRPGWRLIKLPDGLYEIVEVKSGKALTTVTSDHGLRVVIAPWQDKADQKWELIKTDPSTLTM